MSALVAQKGSRACGFSMIEMLVSVAMAAFMTVVMTNVFLANEEAREVQGSVTEVQANGRVALSWLTHDLRMAGNTSLTYLHAPIAITEVAAMNPTVTANCFDVSTQAFNWGLTSLPTATGYAAPKVFGVNDFEAGDNIFSGCVANDQIVSGTDLVSVHYVSAEVIDDSDLSAGNIYLNSGLQGGVVFKCANSGSACKAALTDARTDPSGQRNHLLISRLYFVRPWASQPGDDIPTLVRMNMAANGVVEVEPLIEGVASMQVRYGIDTTDNGSANQYVTADQMPSISSIAGAIQWTRIASVKVSVLMQSTAENFSEAPAGKEFVVGGETVSLSGRYFGETYNVTVAVRNPAQRFAS